MTKKFNKFKHLPKGNSAKKAGQEDVMTVLKRIYFDYLEDVYNKPALAHNNPLEVHGSQLCVRHDLAKLGYINKTPQEILDASIKYVEVDVANYDDGLRSFSYIENPDAKPITISIEK